MKSYTFYSHYKQHYKQYVKDYQWPMYFHPKRRADAIRALPMWNRLRYYVYYIYWKVRVEGDF